MRHGETHARVPPPVTGRTVEAVSDEVLRALLAHDWPGNVRELENALGYAVIHCRGTALAHTGANARPRRRCSASAAPPCTAS